MERAVHQLLIGIGADAGGIEGPDVEQSGGVGAREGTGLARGQPARAVTPGLQSEVIPVSIPTPYLDVQLFGQFGELGPLTLESVQRPQPFPLLRRRPRTCHGGGAVFRISWRSRSSTTTFVRYSHVRF